MRFGQLVGQLFVHALVHKIAAGNRFAAEHVVFGNNSPTLTHCLFDVSKRHNKRCRARFVHEFLRCWIFELSLWHRVHCHSTRCRGLGHAWTREHRRDNCRIDRAVYDRGGHLAPVDSHCVIIVFRF